MLKLRKFEMVNSEGVGRRSADSVGPGYQYGFLSRRDVVIHNKVRGKLEIEARSRLFGRQQEDLNHALSELGEGFLVGHSSVEDSPKNPGLFQERLEGPKMVAESRKQDKLPLRVRPNKMDHRPVACPVVARPRIVDQMVPR